MYGVHSPMSVVMEQTRLGLGRSSLESRKWNGLAFRSGVVLLEVIDPEIATWGYRYIHTCVTHLVEEAPRSVAQHSRN